MLTARYRRERANRPGACHPQTGRCNLAWPRNPHHEPRMADDLSRFEHRLMEVFTHRPGNEQWASAKEAYESMRETDPRTNFGSVFAALERLTWKDYLERKLGEPEPQRGGRGRCYYRATEEGGRRLRNTPKAPARSWLSKLFKPAPTPAG